VGTDNEVPSIDSERRVDMLKRYALYVYEKYKTSTAQIRRFYEVSAYPEVLTSTESCCFFCQGALTCRESTMNLYTKGSQRTVKHLEKKCTPCAFTYRHSDISTGILVYGVHAFSLGLMMLIDEQLVSCFTLAGVWKVSHMYI